MTLTWHCAIGFLAFVASAHAAPSATTRTVPVDSIAGLKSAVQNAQPGDDIVIAAGSYLVSGNISVTQPGTAQAPIHLRAAQPRSVLLRFQSTGTDVVEGFKVSAAWWTFEGVDIAGECANDSQCEHAFHISGAADHTVIRDNDVRDFNAQIKSNGAVVGAVRVFPNDVLIERNVLHDTRARNTSNPVTKLDVVGGRRWIVRANTIFDGQKGQGDGISYAAFLKGNSRDGVFERNLVRCSWHTSGGTRLGLSFGGGGTSPDSICEDASCTPEHQNGIMRNNIIMNCDDVGIYLNKAANSRIQHNTLYATSGIDVRYSASTADLRNNILGGAIHNRDGGTSTVSGNLSGVSTTTFAQWFSAPADANFSLRDGTAFVGKGVAAPLVTDDFCATPRSDGHADIGAVEYVPDAACQTTIGGGIPRDVIFANGFEFD